MYKDPCTKTTGGRIEHGRWGWVGWERLMEGKMGTIVIRHNKKQLLECSEIINKRGVSIITGLFEEAREVPSKQPNITS